MRKNVWIWNHGDWEIFHITRVNLRREVRMMHYPTMWKVSLPDIIANFEKEVDSDGGYIICHTNGEGNVRIDGKHYPTETKLQLSPGHHNIKIHVSNPGGLPAVFVESDVCPSDESWFCRRFSGELVSVGFEPYYDSADKNPESFPFAYETKLPVAKTEVENGCLFDFGTELFGFLDIAGACADQEICIYYGESKEEALDMERTYVTDRVSGKESYRLKQRAFRYIYITPAVSNLAITAEHEYLPLTKQGSFSCDDKLLNEIYSRCVYTFHLNCREGFLDGIKRDRWVWAGDAYQCGRINRYLFADKAIEQRTLRGLLGKEPIDQHLNTILDYSLIWFISLYEHYITYGDKGFLSRIMPMAEKLLTFCETRLNEDGFLVGAPQDWVFIDWADIDKTGAVCAEQMLLVQAYFVMSEMVKYLGISAAIYEEKYEKLKAKVNAFYWNEEKGAFIDSYQSGKNNVTRHANIFAVMYDIATEEQTKSIVEHVLKNDEIPAITTPYFEGYELDVLAKTGNLSDVEHMITSYWGGMLSAGADTIWEEYDPALSGTEHYAMYGGKFDKSLCHAWGAGPIYLFGRYYLGVYPTAPGFETFRVEPNPGSFETMQGTVPIMGGTVTVDFDRESLRVTATKSGGTLFWKGNSYELIPDKTLTLPRK
ncbi:MAG: alpha-rhamnosidase [Clostridia bacterium]|nr:alpha-rhamnosidase [Clostridia bacterium]